MDAASTPGWDNDTLVCKILQITRCGPFNHGFALQCHAEPIKEANRLMKGLKSEPIMQKVQFSHQAHTRNGFK